ncbi:MAG TPA: hypothetical protein EYP41_11365 [Anaerolineae bacterium]|nr:hypothetical protein [Anaerolineae bacterium]
MSYQPLKPSANGRTHRVAIVVPLSNRAELFPDEEISLRHLLYYLGRYDKYLVIPETLELTIPGFRYARFGPEFFGSAAANTRLMLSAAFYERFREYEYILVYHPDALVFSDQLEEWCDAGYDYIGPPWFPDDDMPWVTEPGVGNGGFCLRKVESCLKVLRSPRYAIDPDDYGRRLPNDSLINRLANYPRKYLKHLHYFNNVQREIARFRQNEDLFWSWRATHYYPDFRIAPVDVAMRFAFEGAPRLCYREIGGKLPFGCHAWPKYDRAFWEPYLLQPNGRAAQNENHRNMEAL